MRAIKKLIPDILCACGVVSITIGAFFIYVPAGFIAGGAFLVAAAYLWTKGMSDS